MEGGCLDVAGCEGDGGGGWLIWWLESEATVAVAIANVLGATGMRMKQGKQASLQIFFTL